MCVFVCVCVIILHINFLDYFLFDDPWDERLLFLNGSRDRATACDDWLLDTFDFVGLVNRDDGFRVGILDVVNFCCCCVDAADEAFVAVRPAFSLSIFK